MQEGLGKVKSMWVPGEYQVSASCLPRISPTQNIKEHFVLLSNMGEKPGPRPILICPYMLSIGNWPQPFAAVIPMADYVHTQGTLQWTCPSFPKTQETFYRKALRLLKSWLLFIKTYKGM